jgi:hypothetical protein
LHAGTGQTGHVRVISVFVLFSFPAFSMAFQRLSRDKGFRRLSRCQIRQASWQQCVGEYLLLHHHHTPPINSKFVWELRVALGPRVSSTNTNISQAVDKRISCYRGCAGKPTALAHCLFSWPLRGPSFLRMISVAKG